MTLLRPLGLALLAFLAGLLPALRLAPDPLPLLAFCAIAAALSALVLRRDRTPGVVVGALVVGFAGAGAAAGAFAAHQAAADCRGWIPDGATVRVTGVLGAGIATSGAPLSRVPILPLEHATLSAAGVECRGAVRVRVDTDARAAPAGTRVTVAGEWVRAGGRVVSDPWPGDPFYSGFVAAERVSADPSVGGASPLLAMRGATESALRSLFPRHAPLAEALLLGRRERLDPAISERFARSGLVHLLAISGSHVGLFAAMLLILGGAMRLLLPHAKNCAPHNAIN